MEEVASRFGVHRNTVRDWVRRGLPISDNKRPMLILGRDLFAFLQARRAKNKRPCGPGEIYCVRCRKPQKPAGGMVDYRIITKVLGNLVALCPDCESLMNRRVSISKLARVRGDMEVRMPLGLEHIVESDGPSVNCAFG